MNLYTNFNIYLVLLTLSTFLDVSTSNQILLEDDCAPLCLKIFMQNTEMYKRMEECDKKNMQISDIHSQLAVLRVREQICENTIKEKEALCSNQEQILLSIDRKMEQIAGQSRDADKMLKSMLKEISDYKAAIVAKNRDIRLLETKLQLNEYLLKNMNLNLDNNLIERNVKILETSCISIGNSSEIREIQVPKFGPFQVPCNGTIAGPGWTVIQRRVDKSVDFNRSWDEYRDGFGDLEGNLFIGLENIYRMTNSQPHELFIYLENFNNEIRHAHYKNFSIANETEAYKLQVLDEYSGDAGDALNINVNMKFTTFDRDNDKRSYGNCAFERQGGWWYNQCARSNLNGRYFESELSNWEGIWWWNWGWDIRTLKSVQMLIRPTNNSTINTTMKEK